MHASAHACVQHTFFYSTKVLKHTRKASQTMAKLWAIKGVFKMLDVVAVAITVGFLCFLVLVNCASETSSSLFPSRRILSTNNEYSVNVYSNDCCL